MRWRDQIIGRWLVLLPVLILVLVTIADLALPRGYTVLGLFVMAPLLAASVVGPRLTAAYGLLALLAAAGLGTLWDEVYSEPGALAAQLVRLTGITVGTAAAVAVSAYRTRRERRLAQMTKVAEAAQRAILIPIPERVGPVRIVVTYESAAEDALIGGDLYGLVHSPYGLRVLVGDVRGKGLEAVRMSAQVLAAFRERANDDADLAVLMGHLDAAVLRAGGDEDFVTAVLAQIDDDGNVSIANAGHPPPLVTNEHGVDAIDSEIAHPPLGILLGSPGDGGSAVSWLTGSGATPVHTLRLGLGDRLLLFTDGLVEARRPRDGAFLPQELVSAALWAPDVDDALATLRRALLKWSGGPLRDDVALVLLEYVGAAHTTCATNGGARKDFSSGARGSPSPRRMA